MSAPQMKERPPSMLRAMFAGLGSLLHVVDKVRSKPAEPDPGVTETPAAEPAATVPDPAAEDTAAPETEPEIVAAVVTTAEPDVVVIDTLPQPEIVVADPLAEPEIVPADVATEPEIVAAETTAVPAAGAALPLANYDQSSVASLRARLRNLSVEQLTQLLEYEKSHAARADVISMFERRIVKIQSES